MRRPEDIRRPPRPRRPPRSRVWLAVGAAVLLVLIMSMRGIARFYTDFLWFQELGITSVWRGMVFSKAFLTVGFTLVFFGLLLGNLIIADRLAPTFRPVGAEDEIVARYQEIVGPHTAKVRVGVAALFALIAGTGAGAEWKNWLLFRNSVNFGVKDEQFHRDVSFYVFKMPFVSYVVNWLFVAFVLVLVLTAVAHYLNGGIRLQSPLQRVTPAVKAHVSVLLGLIAITKAGLYLLQAWNLNFSSRGFVEGAGYTDVHAQLPAFRLLTLIMAAAAVLFLVNIWRRSWALPGVAILAWAVVALTAGFIYPAAVQQLKVKPAENERERPYIERNIKASRAAMRLDEVKTTPFPYQGTLAAGDLVNAADTIRNIRLWDPDTLRDTYQALQEQRSYYQFADVDIDRYVIDEGARSVVLSVRGLNPHGLPGKETWVNSHLQYTHGFGAVLSSANAVDTQGRPDLLLRNIPPTGKPELTGNGARVYFSENLPGYAVVRTAQPEIDYQITGEPVTTSYNGEAGVQLSSFRRKFAFFLRFGDRNLLLSNRVTSKSRVIFNRDIATRVRAAAPFLTYDSDPYPVIVAGRILWVYDAYTTTSRFPYSARADTAGLRDGAQLASTRFNYVRNSVKVVVDAFNGTTTFYQVDEKDPLANAYGKAFPGLFTKGSAMPAELRSHLRYPEDLFRVQANMYAEYHVTNPNVFYASNDDWDIAQDPGTGQARTTTSSTPTGAQGGTSLTVASNRARRMEPTYLLIKLPGEEKATFLILQPFVPKSQDDKQKNLTAFMIAKSDPDQYGTLETFEMPRDRQVDGPLIVNNAIQAEPDISREISLLDQQGSSVLLGQVQVIPIEKSLLYVRPLYVTSSQTSLPEVKRVIVVYNGRAVMRPTLRESLVVLFGDAPATLEQGPASTPTPGTPTPTTPAPISGDVDQLLRQAETAFAAADAALKQGDLATYQAKIKEAQALVAEAARRLQASGSSSTTTTTSPTSA